LTGFPWCGIGIERPKSPCNLGTLWRSAVCLGADFIFTIGDRYRREASDTVAAAACIPHFTFADLDDFNRHRPHAAPLVGVELADGAERLETFHHPRQAVYLLGPEDGSLSNAALDLCQHVVSFSSTFCLNVASAGTVVLYDRQTKQVNTPRRVLP
jgi:tRNA (guanosine-2'-O-)-methyltransferase